VASGVDVLVIGRAVTHADDPVAAAISIAEEVAAALS
jgi:orotidine-5'-phosphate decarboxylase